MPKYRVVFLNGVENEVESASEVAVKDGVFCFTKIKENKFEIVQYVDAIMIPLHNTLSVELL